uniref:Uncharacterized protein n=1 Tax=Megaviridae environmental sample TaxID=1737588 RepID=A0A5J6VKY9_9VIRU|nr:MAG: hypothetical protein [Megaviridae environmental sample]
MVKLFQKFIPNILDDIIGNTYQKQQIYDWISTFKKQKKKSLLLIGNHGIGKSSITKLILKKHNINFKIIYPDNIKEYRSNNLFDSYFDNCCFTKTTFIFDEIEMITLTSERKYILQILKQNNKSNQFPIIFICNNNHSKLINDIKKVSKVIQIEVPTDNEITSLVHKVCKVNNIKIDKDTILLKLIKFSQYDIRRLLNIVKDFSYNFTKLNNKNIDLYIENSVKKSLELNLFDSTNHIFNNNLDFNTINRLYETEKVLLPLMIHENYYKKILNTENDVDTNLDYLLFITEALSDGDNIETSIYTDQNWCLHPLHAFYTCVKTSYILNKITKKFNSIEFSSDLNKTSLKNINKKNITNLLNIISNKSIDELLLLCKMTNFFFEKNDEIKLINILKSYSNELSIKEVELCLKIDKTVDFIKITNKKKKEISSII